MAIATVKTVFDGETYDIGDTIPDLGSLNCASVTGRNQRHYEGLSADESKLPTYNSLETGSDCFFGDTGEVKWYNASNKTWYDL